MGAAPSPLSLDQAQSYQFIEIQRTGGFGPVGQRSIRFVGNVAMYINVVEDQPVVRLQAVVWRGLMLFQPFFYTLEFI